MAARLVAAGDHTYITKASYNRIVERLGSDQRAMHNVSVVVFVAPWTVLLLPCTNCSRTENKYHFICCNRFGSQAFEG
jgi:hypothetical protein